MFGHPIVLRFSLCSIVQSSVELRHFDRYQLIYKVQVYRHISTPGFHKLANRQNDY